MTTLRHLRLLSALLALWTSLVVTEQVRVQECPVHGGAGISVVRHASHGGHHHGGAPHPARDHHCACAGSCCDLPPAAAVPLAAVLPAPAGPAHAEPLSSEDAHPLPARSDLRLPFPNGPPAFHA